MEKPKCIICNAELIWGGFAYEQEMCWDCVIFETRTILEQINNYPPVLGAKRELHSDILKWMVAVVASHYGLDSKIDM